ncbi:hypothetical protein JW921_02850, partial [Candidatus Fermentibacterales bacterium]|nr:hypothetical protein [Candidatus Fermentibacterales bacterium]
STGLAEGPTAFERVLEVIANLDPGVFRAELCPGYYRSVDSPRQLLRACVDALAGLIAPYRPGSGWGKGILIHESARVADTASLRGAVWLDRDTRVGENCELENCVILSGARVGPGAVLRSTLVAPGAIVPEGALATDKYPKVLEGGRNADQD